MIKGIIARMKWIYDANRLVRLVAKAEKEIEKTEPTLLRLTGYDTNTPATASIKQRYLKKYRRTTLPRTNRLIEYAIKKRYLGDHQMVINKKPTDTVSLTVEGEEFIDRALWIIPIGLWYAWWKKYGAFLGGIGVGVFISFLVALAKWLLHRYTGI